MTKCAQLGYNVVNMVKAVKRRVFRAESDRERQKAERAYGKGGRTWSWSWVFD